LEDAAAFERMTIGSVVMHLELPRAHAVDDVRLGGMQIAARRVDAKRPAGGAELLPRRQAEGEAKNRTDCGLRIAGCGLSVECGLRKCGWIADCGLWRRQLGDRRAVERSEGTGLRRPVEIPERPGEPVEVMLGGVVIAVNWIRIGHEAISARVSCMRRS